MESGLVVVRRQGRAAALEAFKDYNQGRLGRAANLVGAHRAREVLEPVWWGLPDGPVRPGRNESLAIGSDVNKQLSCICNAFCKPSREGDMVV